jgi:hypothetical protein
VAIETLLARALRGAVWLSTRPPRGSLRRTVRTVASSASHERAWTRSPRAAFIIVGEDVGLSDEATGAGGDEPDSSAQLEAAVVALERVRWIRCSGCS